MVKPRSVAAIAVLLSLILLAVMVLSTAAVRGDDSDPAPNLPEGNPKTKGPWLIYSDDVGRMDIMFETNNSVKDDSNYIEMQVGTDKGYPVIVDRSSHEWFGAPRRMFRFTLTGLVQNTDYDYKIFYSGQADDSDPYTVSGSFRTGPVGVSPELNFLAFGDTRSTKEGLDDMKQVAKAMAVRSSSQWDPAFVLHTGDFVFKGGVGPYQHIYLVVSEPWADTFFGVPEIEKLLKDIPIFGTVGNHDIATDDDPSGWPYLRQFPYHNYDGRVDPDKKPDIGKLFYSFKWGPAHVFSLTGYPMDGYCSHSYPFEAGSDQMKWLESELKAIQYDERPWKIVLFHPPPYDADTSCNQKQVRDNFVPMAEKYGVDLVITGHEHYYARKKVNGIQYLILGGGGGGLSPIDHPEDMDFSKKVFHYGFFEISKDYMNITIKDADGNPFDWVYLDKSPKAKFEIVGDATGPAPLEVEFKDLSSGHRSNYQWDFGDGTTSTSREMTQTHIYEDWGYYTPTLTISTSLMVDTMAKPNAVRVGYDAGFSASPTSGPRPLTVAFDPVEPDTEYRKWDLGDGTKLQDTGTISHTYTENGMFTVIHTVGDDAGGRTTVTRPDYVKVEPYAQWTHQGTWDPFAVQFFDASKGTDVTAYHWDFGDGKTSTEQNPLHYYPEQYPPATDYEVQLTVDFANGLSDMRMHKVTVPDLSERPIVAYLPVVAQGD